MLVQNHQMFYRPFQVFLNATIAIPLKYRDFLGGDSVYSPPSEDYGYDSTPRNALTFAVTGCDGVHYAVLTIDGDVSDDSPVVEVCPMDSNDVVVLAPSFLNYLAKGCGVPEMTMEDRIESEHSSGRVLIPFLRKHFRRENLLSAEESIELTARYSHLIDCRVILRPMVPANLMGEFKVLAGHLRLALAETENDDIIRKCVDSIKITANLAFEFENTIDGELDNIFQLEEFCKDLERELDRILKTSDKRQRIRLLSRTYRRVEERISYIELILRTYYGLC